jgi:hypothetical protein
LTNVYPNKKKKKKKKKNKKNNKNNKVKSKTLELRSRVTTHSLLQRNFLKMKKYISRGMCLKLSKLTDFRTFSAIFTFFRSWKTLETVL